MDDGRCVWSISVSDSLSKKKKTVSDLCGIAHVAFGKSAPISDYFWRCGKRWLYGT